MKKNLFLYLATFTLAIAGIFAACNKDEQETKSSTGINPLKDVPVGKTYTFYGQSPENLENEEICQMQLTLGENGEWTIKRKVISNKMIKSAVELTEVTALHVPEEYISYSDEHTTEFTFPTNGEIKYYFIPFEANNTKSILGSQEPLLNCAWLCGCVHSDGETPNPTDLCSKDGSIKDKTSEAYKMSCIDAKNGLCARVEGGTCRSKLICTPITTPTPTQSKIVSQTYSTFSQGILLPASSLSW